MQATTNAAGGLNIQYINLTGSVLSTTALSYTVERSVDEQWGTVFGPQPVPTDTLTLLSPGQTLTWSWQATDNQDGDAPPGEYRAVLLGTGSAAESGSEAGGMTPGVQTHTRITYYYFGSVRVALRTGPVGEEGEVYYLHGDHLGSMSDVTTAIGGLYARQRYGPYGQVRYSSGSIPTTYNYTGQRLDGTGLLFYGARYYHPLLGRFVQADTIVPNPGNPQSLNRFSYVLNNPLRYTDPTGHVYIGGVTPEDPIPHGCLTPCELVYSPEGLKNTWNAVALIVDFTPGAGDLKGLGEVFTGRDIMTGEDLGNWRWLGLLFVSELKVLRRGDEVLPLINRQISLGGDFAKLVGRAALREYVKTLPIQTHHILSWVNDKWTAKFEEIVGRYGLGLDEAWNIIDIPHLGSHPEQYHQWIFDQLQEIDKIAKGDKAKFLELFNERILKVVESTPEMLLKEWWIWE